MKKDKIKFSEKLALKFRKKLIVDSTKTFLIIAILIAAYVALNLWASQADLPNFDITENKIYTITETTKNAVAKIENDVKIYVYGFEEESTLIDLLKQYTEANEKITYEIITEESNYEMVQKFELSQGYYVLIIESGDSVKTIDASVDFTTYDYVTAQTVDTTEQVITNSIIALNEENKPKVYLSQGHGEYNSGEIAYFVSQLQNEAYVVDEVNLATTGKVPDDCDILFIGSPKADYHNAEVQAVIDYINKGGDIYISRDVEYEPVYLQNFQRILDEFGVTFVNGYIFELGENKALAEYPYIFMPEVSSSNEITKDIFTDSVMWFINSGRLQYKTNEELAALNVAKETLLTTTEEAMFVEDLGLTNEELASKVAGIELSQEDLAAIMTKTVTLPETSETTESKLIIVANGIYITDSIVEELNKQYPLSYIGSNRDFAINSMAYLAGKDNLLTIRKDYASSTYTPTNMENLVVLAIITFVPILIIIIGIVIGAWRKRRK